MLINLKQFKGFAIHALDGNLGVAQQFYFDDVSWAIRYLTVDTGGWLSGKRVLISPYSVTGIDWQARRINVSLTKSQVAGSPEVDTHLPVSRQHEAAFLGYYAYPYYWGGPSLWGPEFFPVVLTAPIAAAPAVADTNKKEESPDSHLRSCDVVTGYFMEATDGEIGHLAGFLMDSETWAIRYLEVATRNWWPGKKVLVSPSWIESLSWMDSEIRTGLSRTVIKSAPEYDESLPVTREYESELHRHYGRPPWWLHEPSHSSPFAAVLAVAR